MSKKKLPVKHDTENKELNITLQDIVDSVEDELLVIDTQYRILFTNETVKKNYRSKDNLVSQVCYQAFYGRDKPCSSPLWSCTLQDVLHNGKVVTTIHPPRSQASADHWRWRLRNPARSAETLNRGTGRPGGAGRARHARGGTILPGTVREKC